MVTTRVSERVRRRRPLANMKTLLLPLALLATLATSADGLEIVFRNLCGKDMLLSNGKTGETIKKDGVVKKTLAVGAVEAFRYGSSGQATLAEFSVQATTTWYDIGIIPTGTFIGPGNCSSLEHCKAVTGGTGFNVAMKIIPRLQEDVFYQNTCRTVNCFADGCPDAYQHPHDPDKTRNCPSSVNFTVVFCATPSTGSLDGAEMESAVVSQPPAPVTLSTASPDIATASSPPPLAASTTHADNSGDGTSVAVIIASIIGGFVTVFAVVILVRRWRYTRLEKMNATRHSSEAMVFIEARDVSAL